MSLIRLVFSEASLDDILSLLLGGTTLDELIDKLITNKSIDALASELDEKGILMYLQLEADVSNGFTWQDWVKHAKSCESCNAILLQAEKLFDLAQLPKDEISMTKAIKLLSKQIKT